MTTPSPLPSSSAWSPAPIKTSDRCSNAPGTPTETARSYHHHLPTDLAAKWIGLLPCPYTEQDTAAGYRYEASVLRAEFSLTQVPGKPVTGRIFSGQAIRDNLHIGRPDRAGLIFGRRIIRKGPRQTPGQFRLT